MLIVKGFMYMAYKVNLLHPKNLIGLIFMLQSSSWIDYGGFRPFKVKLTPLMVNGFNLEVQLGLKSIFFFQ